MFEHQYDIRVSENSIDPNFVNDQKTGSRQLSLFTDVGMVRMGISHICLQNMIWRKILSE